MSESPVRVLVADAVIATAIAQVLNAFGKCFGCRAVAVNSMTAAVRHLMKKEVDVVVTDHFLGDGTAVEFARQAHANRGLQRLPFILWSSYESLTERLEADFALKFKKPCDPRLVVGAIEKLVAERRRSGEVSRNVWLREERKIPKPQWSEWNLLPDPRKSGLLAAPVGRGCYELRNHRTGRWVLFGSSGNVALDLIALLPDPYRRATAPGSSKCEYISKHLPDLEYRTIAAKKSTEFRTVFNELKAARSKYRFRR